MNAEESSRAATMNSAGWWIIAFLFIPLCTFLGALAVWLLSFTVGGVAAGCTGAAIGFIIGILLTIYICRQS